MLFSAGLRLLAGSGAATVAPSLPQIDPIQLNSNTQPSFNLSEQLDLNEFGPFCFDQKISHFEPGINGTVSAELYRPGGPVLLRVSGESASYGKKVPAPSVI